MQRPSEDDAARLARVEARQRQLAAELGISLDQVRRILRHLARRGRRDGRFPC